jgi:hypothetical protein
MSRLLQTIVLEGVDRIHRRNVGYVYRAVMPIQHIYEAVRDAAVLYWPYGQRGLSIQGGDIPEHEYRRLVPLTGDEVQINHRRSTEMAVKFLFERLFSTSLVWNARQEPGIEVEFADSDHKGELRIRGAKITVPDTAHRHYLYYLLGLWKQDPREIPPKVLVSRDRTYTRDEIARAIEEFDPDSEMVYVDVYNVSQDEEGMLFDEFNDEGKPVSTSIAGHLNPNKTVERRFVNRLIQVSSVFGPDEIEQHRSTIGSASRKLTTFGTLEQAVAPLATRLRDLERNEPERYEDLVAFTSAFFDAWADEFPEFRPRASGEKRHHLRKVSFAIANVIFHPLLRLAERLWEQCQEAGVNWRENEEWKNTIALIARTTVKNDSGEVVPIMDRTNPGWRSKILVETLNRATGEREWSISNTRQTREAAFQYLCQVAGLPLVPTRRRAIA